MGGESCQTDQYERPVRLALARLALNGTLVAEVMEAVTGVGPGPNQFVLARIVRDRQAALNRLGRDRDVARWQAETARSDAEEAEAREAERQAISPEEVAAYLRDVPAVYDDAEPVTKRRILQSLLDRVVVLGPSQLWLYPSDEAEARGLAAAFEGKFRAEIRHSGRGERSHTTAA